MGIDTGFHTGGFVDDRREEDRWKQFEERINGSNSNASGDVEEEETPIDGKLNIDSNSEWKEDVHKNMKTYRSRGKKNFFQRNKRQIIDAVIVLGVIYVAYKLFWEKDGDDFAEGGDIEMDSAPVPESVPQPAPQVAPPPPRAEMPEPTYNPQ